MSDSKDQVREQRTFIPWDSSRKEAIKMGLPAWANWFHKPYETDWQQAWSKAVDRQWELMG